MNLSHDKNNHQVTERNLRNVLHTQQIKECATICAPLHRKIHALSPTAAHLQLIGHEQLSARRRETNSAEIHLPLDNKLSTNEHRAALVFISLVFILSGTLLVIGLCPFSAFAVRQYLLNQARKPVMPTPAYLSITGV
ncbi:hypothetical protein, partial [Pseudomonas sp. NBRC 111138]|uniref:hypothetical protein n=1 Tax=Pseudomonas sp. NBRC 111138 TaxID=1661053 RepID=UPI001C48CD1A